MYGGARDFLQNARTYVCVSACITRGHVYTSGAAGTHSRADRVPGAADAEQNGKKKTFLIYSAGRRH